MIPELSIVIGTVDRPGHLNRFVNSIILHTDIPYELIIVDGGDKPIEKSWGDNLSHIKVIEDKPRAGYRQAYNKGFAAATGKYVVFLNDDVEVTRSWAIEAVRFMDANSKWCGMGAIYFSENGPYGRFEIREWLNLPYANFGVISKDLGNRLGWFDDYIYTYGADNSLSFKVFLAGYSISGIPNCKVLHNPILDLNKQANLERQPKDAANILLKYRHRLPEMYAVYRRYPPARMLA